MAKDESFDITTGADLQEVDNAVNQAKREITNRFDFKNVLVEIDYDRHAGTISITTIAARHCAMATALTDPRSLDQEI